ncbi:spore germination protein GerPB [Cohnella lubricantis]|uniref:spore germination protein GerPB n=1 Tax=Cohnella lubricantis TaxID=2163172 RepID=UPI0035E34FFA
MQWNVYQQITIQQLRVGSVSNSSVLQIGSAGSIQSLSQLYNTGGYTEPAPQLGGEFPNLQAEVPEESTQLSLVPFPNPNRP